MSTSSIRLPEAQAAAFTAVFPCPAAAGRYEPGEVDSAALVIFRRDPCRGCSVVELRTETETQDAWQDRGPVFIVTIRRRANLLYECGAERYDVRGDVTWPLGAGTATVSFGPNDVEIMREIPVTAIAGTVRLYDDAYDDADPTPGDWLDDPEVLDRPVRTRLESGEPRPYADPADAGEGIVLDELFDEIDAMQRRIENLE